MKFSVPEATKLSTVPDLVGLGINYNMLSAWVDKQPLASGVCPTPQAGMMLPVYCKPVVGLKIGTPYSLKFPVRAKAVGTVKSFEPPCLALVTW